ELLLTLAFGQVLSLLICGIGLTSKYLADDYHANTPVFQGFLNYILLFLVYTTTLAVRQARFSERAVGETRPSGPCQIGPLSLFYSSDQGVVSAVLVNTATHYRKWAGNVCFQNNERATRAAACQPPRVHELRPNNDAHLLQSDNVEAVILQQPCCRDPLALFKLDLSHEDAELEKDYGGKSVFSLSLSNHYYITFYRQIINKLCPQDDGACMIPPRPVLSENKPFTTTHAYIQCSFFGGFVGVSLQWRTILLPVGEENLLAILKRRWWKYMILGLIDIEANYLVIKAYQYTTLTSVQLLDCFVIPVVLLLSWFFLLVRYKVLHFVGVGVCLLGMGCMVGADVLVGRQQGLGDHKLLGDLLVLAGATLYGISNVCEEFIVKNLSRVEFLGMMGLFGSFFSGIQLAIMEHKELLRVQWDWQIGLLYIGFSACMFGLYSFMPVVIKRTSATAVNLSLLTADLYSLFCGLFLFQYKVRICSLSLASSPPPSYISLHLL
ncbi:Solute carrier family 35 member F1, partial [Anabarilius grahami]